jgi:hypothetical protein
MYKKQKRKRIFLICLISQCLWVYNIFCCSLVSADIEIVTVPVPVSVPVPVPAPVTVPVPVPVQKAHVSNMLDN